MWAAWLWSAVKDFRQKALGQLCSSWWFLSYCFWCCDKTQWPKAAWGRKGLFHLTTLRLHSVTERSQDRSSRQEPSGRNWSRSPGEMTNTGWFPMAYSACFLLQPQTTYPGFAPPTMGWAIAVTNEERVPQGCLQVNLIGGILLTVEPS